MEYVISIAKRYNHARTITRILVVRGIKGAKPVLGIYYLTEEGKLRFRKIFRFMVPCHRTRLWKRRRFYCLRCGNKFVSLIKKEADEITCPYCYE
jgi:hypothetical protein